MITGNTFYHGILQKYVILFGTMFNDIWINRTDSDGNVTDSLKVPITYSPQEKMLARIEGILDGNQDSMTQEVATVLPRLGFEINGFTYASERKLKTLQRFTQKDNSDADVRDYIYDPVPYDINFTLSIFVKNTTDGTQIIEQILPYFTPEWTNQVELVPGLDTTMDIPVVLQDISQDDVYEVSFEERRALIWSLNFVMKGYFFGPPKKQGVIKFANQNWYDATIFDDIDDAIGNASKLQDDTLYPGLTANGEPSFDANNTISANSIYSSDDYGFINIRLNAQGEEV